MSARNRTNIDGLLEAILLTADAALDLRANPDMEAQGVARDTVVIFLSDNGRPFPRCKTTVLDSGLRTPLIVRWPSGVAAQSVAGGLVNSIDLAPTIL